MRLDAIMMGCFQGYQTFFTFQPMVTKFFSKGDFNLSSFLKPHPLPLFAFHFALASSSLAFLFFQPSKTEETEKSEGHGYNSPLSKGLWKPRTSVDTCSIMGLFGGTCIFFNLVLFQKIPLPSTHLFSPQVFTQHFSHTTTGDKLIST